MKLRVGLLILAGLVLTGCKTGVLKDPNDPADAGVLAPEILRRNLKGVSDMLNDRLAAGEIGPRRYQALIEDAAKELLAKVNIDRVDPAHAWEYVEVLRTAGRWEDVERFAKVAVKSAQKTQNADRLVNDTLRLAQAQAKLGRVKEAIATARSVYGAKPTDAAPILPATLYEIVPAGRGKGHDPELAKLLEDAIDCHMGTIVDVNSEAGKMFILARPTHIQRAWSWVITLYRNANQPAEAEAAAKRAQAMIAQFGRV